MSKLIKEPDSSYIDSNRGSMAYGQKDLRVSQMNNILQGRNLSMLSQDRLSNISRISCLEFEPYYQNVEPDSALMKHLIKIQKWVKWKLFLLRIKKKWKKSAYRLKIIREMVSTEEDYVKKLKYLNDWVQKPLMRKSIDPNNNDFEEFSEILQPLTLQYLSEVQISKQDVENIFSNLESILEVNSKFASDMKARRDELISNKDFIREKFADICVQYAPDLKIYVTYLNNYEKATKTLDNLKTNNINFKKFCSHLENYDLKGHDLSDFLIKPVQRLPKYILLLKDILKNTENWHRDHDYVEQALRLFNEVCMHNNEQMDKFIRDNRLIELDRKFCRPDLKQDSLSSSDITEASSTTASTNQSFLVRFSTPFQKLMSKEGRAKTVQAVKEKFTGTIQDANANGELKLKQKGVDREFLWEETLNLFQNDSQRQVTVYFLSDVVLVSVKENQERETLFKYLRLNEKSFFKDMSDLKYFSNLISISGVNESLTFICESGESKSQLLTNINMKIIRPLILKRWERQNNRNNDITNSQNNQLDRPSLLSNEAGSNSNNNPQEEKQPNNSTSATSSLDAASLKPEDQMNQQKDDDIFYQIQVRVIGTQEIDSTNKFKKTYTVYITEILIETKVVQKIFVRFSEMKSLKNDIKVHAKEINYTEEWPNQYFRNHKTKLIEKRKILIENFLQKVLSHQGIEKHPFCPEILQKLNLPHDFYSIVKELGNLDYLNNINYEKPKSKQSIDAITVPQCYNNRQSVESDTDKQFNYEDAKQPFDKEQNGNKSENSNNKKENQVSVGASTYMITDKLEMKQYIDDRNNNNLSSVISNQEESPNNNTKSCIPKINEHLLEPSSITINQPNQNRKLLDIRQAYSVTGAQLRSSSSNPSSHSSSQMDNSSINQSMNFGEKEIKIWTQDNQSHSINITKTTTAFDIIIKLSKDLNLASYLDFRLFIEDDLKHIRLLDYDEPIFKLIFKEEFKKKDTTNNKPEENSIEYKSIKKSILHTLGLKHTYTYSLKFIKYIWLKKELEEFDYKSDPVRLQLMASQVLNDISQEKFHIVEKDYCLYSVLYLYINYPQLIHDINKDRTSKQLKSTLFQRIKQFLPSNVLKQNKEHVWIENMLFFIESTSEYISMLIKNNKKMMRESLNPQSIPAADFDIDNLGNSNDQTTVSQDLLTSQVISSEFNPDIQLNQDSSYKENNRSLSNGQDEYDESDKQKVIGHLQQINSKIITNKKNMACMTLLKRIMDNPLYGATLFECKTYKTTINDAKEHKKLIIPKQVFVGIKCDSITILDSTKLKEIKFFKISEIKEQKVFPVSIIFLLKDDPVNYRFDTQKSFEINQLINAYSSMNNKLEHNPITLDQESINLKSLQQQHNQLSNLS